MTLPDTLFTKARGDAVKSDDWNVGFAEVNRLDGAKVNRDGGDTIHGQLTVAGPLAADSLVVPPGALTPAMLGFKTFDVVFELQNNLMGRLTIEQYSAHADPPPFPAYVRFVSVTLGVTVHVEGETVQVEESVPGNHPFVRRALNLVQTTVDTTTVTARVFTIPEAGTDWQPSYEPFG
jgi:hypothetical protein